MDKSSAAYKKAMELDRLGLAQKLQHDSTEFFNQSEEVEKAKMGSTIGVVIDKANQALHWAMDPSKTVEDDEFEYNDLHEQQDVVVEEPEIRIDPEEDEISNDPLLEKDKERIHEAMVQLKTVFTVKKALTFSLPIEPTERTRFREFINWINQTSGNQYVMSELGVQTVIVTKLPTQETIQCSVGTSSFVEAVDEDYGSPPGSSVSHADSCRPMSPPVEISSKSITANCQSIMAQLTNRVIIPSRNPKGRGKKLTLSNLGVPHNEVIGILTDDPKMKMEGLIRKIYV